MPKSFLGRGWKFPVQVDSKTGRIMMSEYEDDISEAIRIILMTSKGERTMLPAFGSDIHKYIFDLTDETTLRMLEGSISEAIMIWEPRVGDVSVVAEYDQENPEKVNVNVQYVVRATNNLYNLVYPFYIYEGTK